MGGAEAQTQVSLTPGCCFPIREQPSTSSEGFLTNLPAAPCSNLQTWLGRASARFSCGGLSWTDGPGSRHGHGPSQVKSSPSLSSPLPSSMVPRPNCGHDWPGTECHTLSVMSRASAPSPGEVGRRRQRTAQAREGSTALRGEGGYRSQSSCCTANSAANDPRTDASCGLNVQSVCPCSGLQPQHPQ